MTQNKSKSENAVKKVGLNLSLLKTLVNFLEYGISDKSNFTNTDIENLICVIKTTLHNVVDDYEFVEQLVD